MIPAPLIPWLILAFLALVGASGATGYWQGAKHTADRIAAQAARDAVVAQDAQDKALQAAAAAIAKIDVKNVTIRQKAEVVTREVPVYTDCRHDPRTLGLLNDALEAGTAPKPAAGGKLPKPDAAGG